MNTTLLLMAQYGRAVVPLEDVRRDYFGHLSVAVFARRAAAGDLPLPVMRIGEGNKAGRGVHVQDMAAYLDQQREAARREFEQINGRP